MSRIRKIKCLKCEGIARSYIPKNTPRQCHKPGCWNYFNEEGVDYVWVDNDFNTIMHESKVNKNSFKPINVKDKTPISKDKFGIESDVKKIAGEIRGY